MNDLIPFDSRITACFTGHRDPDPGDLPLLPELIRDAVLRAYGQGIRVFECGGARGFDLLAAREVLFLRETCPELRLWLVLPYENQWKDWSRETRTAYEAVAESADRVTSLSPKYYKGCMLLRDRFMVEHACQCICYLKRSGGGTVYTAAYALRRGLELVNLAMDPILSRSLKEEAWNYTYTFPSASGNAGTAILPPSPARRAVYRPISAACSLKPEAGAEK